MSSASGTSTQVDLPGFGLPLGFCPPSMFPSALQGSDPACRMPLTTLREFAMVNFMNVLSDKPGWDKKVFDDGIVQKWKHKALSVINGMDMTEAMFKWCIAELRYKAGIFAKTGAISVFDGDVVKSDTAIPESLKEALKQAAAPLEDVPPSMQDWHPGSDEKVLDLVHPSLFPLVSGKTRILLNCTTTLEDCIKRCGEGLVLPVPPKEGVRAAERLSRYHSSMRKIAVPYSQKFQWLPCDVDISNRGTKISSYINNLHPTKNRALYQVIEKLISHVIPLWNMTLSPLRSDYGIMSRINYCKVEYDLDPENGTNTEGGDDDGGYEGTEVRYEDTRRLVYPEPEEFNPPEEEKTVDLRQDYGDKGLQVIVKLVNIHLTPEKARYNGDFPRVEGQLNEHICATALYYYDSSNTTTSRIEFLQSSNTDTRYVLEHPENDRTWLGPIFGCENGQPGVQNIGAIDTKEGRCITFPNILQHQVQPFELEDPSKPGHRKILALFLVDPNIRVISTANVPCQRRDWWAEELSTGGESGFARLPAELQEHVVGGVEEFPIGLEEAKEVREELMDERKRLFRDIQDKTFKSSRFFI